MRTKIEYGALFEGKRGCGSKKRKQEDNKTDEVCGLWKSVYVHTRYGYRIDSTASRHDEAYPQKMNFDCS